MRFSKRLTVLSILAGLSIGSASVLAAPPDPYQGDPYKSLAWVSMKNEYIGAKSKWQFDDRVAVKGPTYADDPLNVPITVSVNGLADVQEILVLVDRNPIRRVLSYEPLVAQPAVSFRFKLEQASAVRALARTKDGVWHVGGTWVESAGGGCTVSGASRKDGSWAQTLGQVSGKLFENAATDVPGQSPGQAPGGATSARLRLRVMHPMDTGLVSGVPAFYIKKLSVLDGAGAELLRMATYEPVSENPVFSFDFKGARKGPFTIVGMDNNGNRISSRIP
jgi:sulfur-oxidizing protein SoxY